MPLTLAELQDIQAEAMADDLEIDFDKMSLWRADDARAFFESGGETEPAPPKAEVTGAFTNGSKPTGKTPWLASIPREQETTPAKFRVIAFSWTGNRGGQGSAHNIRRTPITWAKELGNEIELYEVAYTGRGTRMKEPLRSEPKALVTEVAEALGGALADGLPYCFVGFAFGAVLAYEVGKAIATASKGTQGPALVVAVSSEGPSWAGRSGSARSGGPLHKTDEAAFRAVLTEKGGTDFILKDAGMSKMYLPVIKADISLEELYAPPKDTELASFPLLSVYGTKTPGRDKEKSAVSKESAELWASATTSTCSVVGLDGVDWYVFQEEKGVKATLSALKERLAAAVAAPVAVS